MKKNWWVIAALVAVLAVGTVLLVVPYLLKPKVLVTLGVPLSYQGFQVWPTPRTFDQPGTLFVLNGERIIHVGEVLQPKKAGEETLVGATTTDSWNGTLLAQYLGTTPAKLNVKSDQKITVKVQLSGGERWRIDTQLLDSALNAVKWPTADGGPIMEEEGTPYIVTEAIAVRGMNYDVTIDRAQSGAVEMPEIGSANGSVSAQKISGNSYSLNQSFSQPHYVFYMASKLRQVPGYLAPSWQIEPEEDRLTWTHEELAVQR